MAEKKTWRISYKKGKYEHKISERMTKQEASKKASKMIERGYTVRIFESTY